MPGAVPQQASHLRQDVRIEYLHVETLAFACARDQESRCFGNLGRRPLSQPTDLAADVCVKRGRDDPPGSADMKRLDFAAIQQPVEGLP